LQKLGRIVVDLCSQNEKWYDMVNFGRKVVVLCYSLQASH
jgi:hypothetical protein